MPNPFANISPQESGEEREANYPQIARSTTNPLVLVVERGGQTLTP